MDKFDQSNRTLLEKRVDSGISEEDAKNVIELDSSGIVDMSDDDQWEDLSDDFKMTFVVNTSLDMSNGKIASQVAQAALGLYQQISSCKLGIIQVEMWQQKGEKKFVLQVGGTENLLELEKKAVNANVSNLLVRDGDSVSVLALFGSVGEVDSVAGDLKSL
ncbi:probable peptidyl-tRNA hydrolase 2 isoform X2 [Cimex lectularius]|uniref:peptidyl-tRNA hydrolase n=1 Tax=Cimex lectularius TaxID=79782 RepID=A0A8I6SDN6_CIMLE|nr:probable peptidyl-tRNA hydrolase 2 isoform X2 [Cimex lectularius]